MGASLAAAGVTNVENLGIKQATGGGSLGHVSESAPNSLGSHPGASIGHALLLCLQRGPPREIPEPTQKSKNICYLCLSLSQSSSAPPAAPSRPRGPTLSVYDRDGTSTSTRPLGRERDMSSISASAHSPVSWLSGCHVAGQRVRSSRGLVPSTF